MLQLLAQQENYPESMLDVLLWPVALTLLGILIFYGGLWVENRVTKAPWKWVALLPLAYGIYIGFTDIQLFGDPVYRTYVTTLYGTYRMMAAHWGALVIPILGVVGVLLFQKFKDRMNFNRDE